MRTGETTVIRISFSSNLMTRSCHFTGSTKVSAGRKRTLLLANTSQSWKPPLGHQKARRRVPRKRWYTYTYNYTVNKIREYVVEYDNSDINLDRIDRRKVAIDADLQQGYFDASTGPRRTYRNRCWLGPRPAPLVAILVPLSQIFLRHHILLGQRVSAKPKTSEWVISGNAMERSAEPNQSLKTHTTVLRKASSTQVLWGPPQILLHVRSRQRGRPRATPTSLQAPHKGGIERSWYSQH